LTFSGFYTQLRKLQFPSQIVSVWRLEGCN